MTNYITEYKQIKYAGLSNAELRRFGLDVCPDETVIEILRSEDNPKYIKKARVKVSW